MHVEGCNVVPGVGEVHCDFGEAALNFDVRVDGACGSADVFDTFAVVLGGLYVLVDGEFDLGPGLGGPDGSPSWNSVD